jgi:hypothetical protein
MNSEQEFAGQQKADFPSGPDFYPDANSGRIHPSHRPGGCEEKPVREKQIPAELDRLQKEVSRIRDLVLQLNDALTPALTPIPKPDAKDPAHSPQQDFVGIAREVRSSRRELADVTSALHSFLDRLEI